MHVGILRFASAMKFGKSPKFDGDKKNCECLAQVFATFRNLERTHPDEKNNTLYVRYHFIN